MTRMKTKRGRKGKYETHIKPHLKEIEEWCAEGLIEIEICKRLDISLGCFQEYKKLHDELNETLKRGKQIPDYKVENALFQRAIGMEYEEVETIAQQGGRTEKTARIKKVKRFIPPDTGACIFWLKNRLPDKWKDKQQIELVSVNDIMSALNSIQEGLGDKVEKILAARINNGNGNGNGH